MSTSSRVATLVTGANGFVGSAVVNEMERRGLAPIQIVRSAPSPSRRVIVAPAFLSVGLAAEAFDTARSVVHAAARVHVMHDTAEDPLAEFRRINVDGTLRLARQASVAGVRRFVFVSSIKVNGEGTPSGRPYRADDPPAPADPYGISKLEAEVGLAAIAAETGMEVCVVRPVLVYGPGVKGNFASMLRWVARGVPLPLGSVHNRRSLVAVDNLVDLLITCTLHPAAANQTFLVSDGEDLSTTDLMRRSARAMGKSPRLLSVPASAMRLGARLIGKGDVAQRLLGSLQVDISKTREMLGWTPPVGVDQALAATAASLTA